MEISASSLCCAKTLQIDDDVADRLRAANEQVAVGWLFEWLRFIHDRPRNQSSFTGVTNTGPLVSFARSGIAAHWKATAYQSILELAEACDVPVRWSCRTGVCHSCESGLVSGAVVYGPEPLDKPANGNLLVCCSQPIGDVVIDL